MGRVEKVRIIDDSKLLYLQVVDQIKEDIKQKKILPGVKLPSEPELAKRLGVSRATLREALIVLENENIIKRVHGIGTFVKEHALIESGIEEMSSITEMIVQNGQTPGTSMFLQELIESDLESQAHFNMESGEKILFVKRIRTANGKPVIYCLDKLPARLFKNEYQFSEESLFKDLRSEANIEIAYAISHIEAVGYHPEISSALNCDDNTSLLVLKQMHYDKLNQPILYSINYFRSDKFNFTVVRKRR